jgi:5-methylcytosine-specific restriction protein A
LFDQQPLCVLCLEAGRVTIATIADHLVPLAEGGPDTEANTQPLCKACHDVKSQAEAARGRTRR